MADVVGNRVKVASTPVDAATAFTLGTKIDSFSDFTDGVVKYAVLSDNNLWEIGTGTVTGTTLTRDTIEENHLGTTANVDFTSAAELQIAQVLSVGKYNEKLDKVISADVDFNNFSILNLSGLGFQGGQTITWNPTELTLDVPTGLGPVMQVGQETYMQVYNDTGSIIPDKSVVSPITALNDRPSISLVKSDTHEKIENGILMTTMDIPIGGVGFAVSYGIVRDIDTSGFSLGDTLWLDADTLGAITNVKPSFPDYAMQIGGVIKTHATQGQIFVLPAGSIHETTQNFFNGTFREYFDFTVSSDGSVVTGSLAPADGHPNMTMIFSEGFTTLDTTPPRTIVLTAGTDGNPQVNYVYIPIGTKLLTISTSSFPTAEEHIKIAKIVLQSAALTQTDGALVNQNTNDGLQDTDTGQGQLSDLLYRIRLGGAAWFSGTEGTSTIVGASTPDDVFVSTTAGVVYQLHRQTMPSVDTQTGDTVHIVNHSTTPFVAISNLNTQTLDANGDDLNNTSFSFVLWGLCNKGGQPSHLALNLPTGSYAYVSPEDAVSDALNHSVYEIPRDYLGVGFLIARFTYTYKNNVWSLEDTEDLRGRYPNTSAGGGSGGIGVTTFLSLTDTESSYLGNAGQYPKINVGETGLEFYDLQAELDTKVTVYTGATDPIAQAKIGDVWLP